MEQPQTTNPLTASDRSYAGKIRRQLVSKLVSKAEQVNAEMLDQAVVAELETSKSFKLTQAQHTIVRRCVYDQGCVGFSGARNQQLLKECYEECGIGEFEFGKQRVVKTAIGNYTGVVRTLEKMLKEDDVVALTERVNWFLRKLQERITSEDAEAELVTMEPEAQLRDQASFSAD